MRLNRDVILSAIIKHQSSFLQILDFIDQQNGVPDIPEMLYLNLYSQKICQDNDVNVQAHLSLQTLLENGVFIHHDKNLGRLAVADVIIDLLRFIDVKRARELNRYDLEDLRQRVSDYVSNLCDATTSMDSSDLNELLGSFYRLLSEIHSKIKENVAALDAQVRKVSQHYKEFNTGNTAISVFELYDTVTELHDKYVLPCYEFIDPMMEMKGKKTLTQSINQLIAHLASYPDRLNESNRLQYRFTAISSYYKDIGALVKKLKQYSTYLAQDRDRFLAIENAFNALVEDMVPLRHGKQKNKYLTPNSSVFQSFTILDGLREHKSTHAPKLNWFEGRTSLRFKEYLNLLESLETKPSRRSLSLLPKDVFVEEERQMDISKIMSRISIPDTIHDVHDFVFNVLSEELTGFWLGDVLCGIEEIMPYIAYENLVFSQQRRRQQDDKYYLDYLNVELKGSISHV
ncbi:hypothetical protein D210916BOD24_00450 [Alteromonas sp. D210916BOD_24]|uniref:hypothetical protein n=1 Tax=Alteromonas sp. D210916BOD_24 TaxID=3157618 RepID=UPI00399CCE44